MDLSNLNRGHYAIVALVILGAAIAGVIAVNVRVGK